MFFRTFKVTGATWSFAQSAYFRILHQVGWVVVPYGLQQLLRLGTNVLLARLLTPEIFGIMLLVNTLRTGAELLSDIGIGQSVVRSPRGGDPDFLNAAWTLQVLRGAGLSLLIVIAAEPLSLAYSRPELFRVTLAISPVFLLSALASPAVFMMQKRIELRKRAVFEIGCTTFQCGLTILLSYLLRDVWALVLGLIFSVAFSSAASYLLDSAIKPRVRWNNRHVREIVEFGRWIFLSTVIYFAATSFDRIYFVAVLSLTMAGVYGISRTYSDMLNQLAQRAGAFLIFPKMASLQDSNAEVVPRFRKKRFEILSLVAVVTGLAISAADMFVIIAYDDRYKAAAFMVPSLLIGTWFAILSSFTDSMLMGSGRPAPGAIANGAKFVALVAGLSLAVGYGDMVAAIFVLVAAELVRWMCLVPTARRHGFIRPADDLLLTVLMMTTAVGAKYFLSYLGLVPSLGEWWAMRDLMSL